MSDKVSAETASLLDGRRSFIIKYPGDVDKEFFIGAPTADDIRKADWEHAKTYNKALKEGVLTAGEMTEILKARNIIGPEYDKAGDTLKASLGEKIVEMERELNKEKRFQLALEVARLREEVFQWNHRVTGPMAATCESMANDSRAEAITSAIVQDKSGKRVWPTFDDFRNERDLALQTKARFEVMMWMEGVEADFLEKSPERLILQEILNEESEAEAEEEPVAELVVEEPISDTPPVVDEKPAVPKTRGKKAKKNEAV